MAIAEIFKERFPNGSLFFIQAGLEQHKVNLDRLGKVYQLPQSFMDRQYFKKSMKIDVSIIQRRSDRCSDILAHEKPDLFITEFFPLGMCESRFELLPSLIKLSKARTQLWAVAGYPLVVDSDGDWRERIWKLYQKIIIFSPENEKDALAKTFRSKDDRRKYLSFFQSHEKQISFAGYLLARQKVVKDNLHENIRIPKLRTGVKRVTVVRGGGIYYPKMIVDAIYASDLAGEEFYFTVIAGPATTAQEWSVFSRLVRKKKIRNLRLMRSTSHYEEFIKKSDLCIGMSGYHTSVMLLKYQKKSIVIPFEGYGNQMSFSEQPSRAKILRKSIGSQIILINELTPQRLADAIRLQNGQRKSSSTVKESWFAGDQTLDQFFRTFLTKKQ